MSANDQTLLTLIAGQVAIGLMLGDDDQLTRAHVALTAIGLMVLNASDDRKSIEEILKVGETGTISVLPKEVKNDVVPD